MLTLQEHPDNVFICYLEDGKKKQKIWWHPRKDLKLRMSVDSLDAFNTERFRDRFKISKNQADEIISHIKNKTTPEGGIQSRYFKVKKYLDDALFTEMDVRDSKQKIVVDYPSGNKTWGELELICGSSGQGKTWYLSKKCQRCLDGCAKNKRKILWVSNEFNIDKTLKTLKTPKYSQWFRGLDVSQESFEASPHDTPQDFFDTEVKPIIEMLEEGDLAIFDDSEDTPIRKQLRFLITKMLRTCRHRGVGVAYILHRIKSGLWSQQASSSCKYYTVFPKSMKGKITEFIKEQGLPNKDARRVVADYGDCESRHMIVRLHAPTCFINNELLRLF